MKNQVASDIHQRRLALLFPLLIVPFLTLLFWTFGGGRTGPALETGTVKTNVNMEIPEASFEKNRPQDKMSFYTQAMADSVKKSEMSRNDPYFNQIQGSQANGFGYHSNPPSGINNNVYGGLGYSDPNEAKIYGKLNELNAVLNQPPPIQPSNYSLNEAPSNSRNNDDLERLEAMMNMMQKGESKGDPEMQQINGLLEKILDIQHPERTQEKINADKFKNNGQVYSVSTNEEESPISLMSALTPNSKRATNGFFGLEESQDVSVANSISAVVHDNQTIVSGSIVKLRLTTDIMIRGELIPKDNFLFGLATISGERLKIEVNTIRNNNSIFPVRLIVYDLDGLDGIHVPGAISRDVAKESGTDIMQGLGINSFDPNLATQAASAGIELSKNLIRRKVKLVKVTLKAGYKLLLKDEKQDSANQ